MSTLCMYPEQVKQKCKVLSLLEAKGVVLATKAGPPEKPWEDEREFAPVVTASLNPLMNG